MSAAILCSTQRKTCGSAERVPVHKATNRGVATTSRTCVSVTDYDNVVLPTSPMPTATAFQLALRTALPMSGAPLCASCAAGAEAELLSRHLSSAPPLAQSTCCAPRPAPRLEPSLAARARSPTSTKASTRPAWIRPSSSRAARSSTPIVSSRAMCSPLASTLRRCQTARPSRNRLEWTWRSSTRTAATSCPEASTRRPTWKSRSWALVASTTSTLVLRRRRREARRC